MTDIQSTVTVKLRTTGDGQVKASFVGMEQGAEAATKATRDLGETSAQASERIKSMVKSSMERVDADRAALDAENRLTAAARERTATTAQQAQAVQAGNAAAREQRAQVEAQMATLRDYQRTLEKGAATRSDIYAQEERLDRLRKSNLITDKEHAAALQSLDADEKRIVASYQQEEDAITRLTARYDPAGAALKRLAADEKALNDALAKGTISQERYDKTLRGIGSQRAVWEDMAKGGEKAGNAMSHISLKSAGAKRELGYLFGSAMRGDMYNFESSLISLGNRSGALGLVMTGAGAAIASTVGVLGLLAAAEIKAEEDTAALNRAIISTGNFAGTTSGELEGMIGAIGSQHGQFGDARKAVLALAGSGKIMSEQMQQSAQAALDMATVTGKSVDESVQAILKLQGAPSQAVVELNNQYHFLTAAQYTQIKALEDEGHTRRAAAIAEKTYADALHSRAQDVRADAGIMIRAGHSIAEAWDGAWNSISHAGAPSNFQDRLAPLQDELNKLLHPEKDVHVVGDASRTRGLAAPLVQQRVQQLRDQIAAIRGEQAKAGFDTANQRDQQQANQDAIAARSALDKYASPDVQLSRSLHEAKMNRARALYGVVDPAERQQIESEYKQQVKQARESYASAMHDSASTSSAFSGFKDTLKQMDQAFTKSMQQLKAERSGGLRDETSYYQAQKDLIAQHERQVMAALDTEEKALKARKSSGAEQIRLNREIAAVEARRAKAESEAAAARKKADTEHQAALKKEADAVAAYQATLDKMLSTRANAIDQQVAGVGLGQQENALFSRINQAHQSADQRLAQLNQSHNQGQISGAVYQRELAALKAYEESRVQMEIDADTRLRAAREDWSNGVISSLQDVRDQGQNLAGGMAGAVTGAFNDMTDALSQWVKTGHLSFKTLADDFIQQIVRMELKAEEAKLASSLLSWMGVGGVSYAGGSGAAQGTGAFSGFGASQTVTHTVNALGGVYNSPSLSSYSGKVYDSPQVFAFANGAGVFGEAGPEAIMPLKRGPDGALGVRGAGGAGPLQLHVTLDNKSGTPLHAKQRGAPRMDGNKMMVDFVINAVRDDLTHNGPISQAGQSMQGWSRRGVPVSGG